MGVQATTSKKGTSANASAVTPSDSVDLPKRADGGLYVSVTGNVVLIVGGQTITLTGVAANTIIPLAATRVKATGTTATVIALY
jgi:hypothetical protein